MGSHTYLESWIDRRQLVHNQEGRGDRGREDVMVEVCGNDLFLLLFFSRLGSLRNELRIRNMF